MFKFIIAFLSLVPPDSNKINLNLPSIKTEHFIPYSPETEDDFYDTGWIRSGFVFYDGRIEPEVNILGIGTQYSEMGLVSNPDDYVTYSHKHRLKRKK